MHASELLLAHGAPVEVAEILGDYRIATREDETFTLVMGISVLGNVFTMLPLVASYDEVVADIPAVSEILGKLAIIGPVEVVNGYDGTLTAFRYSGWVAGEEQLSGDYDGVSWPADDAFAEVDDYVASPEYDHPMSVADILQMLNDIDTL